MMPHSTRKVDAPRAIPGEVGIWILVVGDLLMFGLMFSLFTRDLGRHRQMFFDGQSTLNAWLGLVNTILLLTGSWGVVNGIEFARRNNRPRCASFLAIGIASGIGFLLVKSIEYFDLIRRGYSVVTNEFYAYYFMVTGIHLFHLVIGVLVLSYFWRAARNSSHVPSSSILEAGGCYWHMVDLLWIGIFAIVYLLK